MIVDYDVIVTSRTPYDTHAEEVINRAKLNVNTPGSVGGVKTDRHTDRIALYTTYFCKLFCIHYFSIDYTINWKAIWENVIFLTTPLIYACIAAASYAVTDIHFSQLSLFCLK